MPPNTGNGRPKDDPSQPQDDSGGAMRSLVKVESVVQLCLVLPIAVFLGWLGGAALDRWLGQHWIYIVGLLLGAVAGFLQIFRFVLAQSKQ